MEDESLDEERLYSVIENQEREEVRGVNGCETADSEGRSLVSIVGIGIGGSNQARSCTRSGSAIRPALPHLINSSIGAVVLDCKPGP